MVLGKDKIKRSKTKTVEPEDVNKNIAAASGGDEKPKAGNGASAPPPIKASPRVRDGKAKYEFKNGYKAYQEELSGEEFGKYMKLVQDNIEVASVAADNASASDLHLRAAFSPKVQREFLKLVLKGEDADKINLGNLKVSEVEQVLEDFFTLHPSLMQWFMLTSRRHTAEYSDAGKNTKVN